MGLYQHPPTGEYRLLLHMRAKERIYKNDPCFVFALGCNQLRPRCIGHPPEPEGFFDAPVLVSGNLHWSWCPYTPGQLGKIITVFDTTTESFRLMRGPVVQTTTTFLYEMDGTLGVYNCNYSMTTIDIWVMQDYDSEVWSHKYHVKLLVAEIEEHENQEVTVVHEEGNVFVLYNFDEYKLCLVDTAGKLLASSQLNASISLTATHRFKESLVQHIFFSALQGDLNAWSFI
ncbi:unnamed protein product [Alopecurus aequalis]